MVYLKYPLVAVFAIATVGIQSKASPPFNASDIVPKAEDQSFVMNVADGTIAWKFDIPSFATANVNARPLNPKKRISIAEAFKPDQFADARIKLIPFRTATGYEGYFAEYQRTSVCAIAGKSAYVLCHLSDLYSSDDKQAAKKKPALKQSTKDIALKFLSRLEADPTFKQVSVK